MTQANTRVIDLTVSELEILIGRKVKESFPTLLSHLPRQEKEKELLSIDEASVFTGIPKQSLYAMSSKGKIPCSRRGKRLIFFRDTLLSWVREGAKETISEVEKKINKKIVGRKK